MYVQESPNMSPIQSKLDSVTKNTDITGGEQIIPAFSTLPAGRFKKLVPGSFDKANKSKSAKKKGSSEIRKSVSPVKNKLRDSLLPNKKIIKGGKTSKRNKNYESLADIRGIIRSSSERLVYQPHEEPAFFNITVE